VTPEPDTTLLEKALALVTERSNWTKRAFARDRNGHRVSFDSRRAVRFCAGGALLRALLECDPGLRSAGALLRPASLLNEALCGRLSESESVELVASLQHKRRTGSGNLSASDQHWQQIVEVNDLPTTRHRHVVAAFEAAIREARSETR